MGARADNHACTLGLGMSSGPVTASDLKADGLKFDRSPSNLDLVLLSRPLSSDLLRSGQAAFAANGGTRSAAVSITRSLPTYDRRQRRGGSSIAITAIVCLQTAGSFVTALSLLIYPVIDSAFRIKPTRNSPIRKRSANGALAKPANTGMFEAQSTYTHTDRLWYHPGEGKKRKEPG